MPMQARRLDLLPMKIKGASKAHLSTRPETPIYFIHNLTAFSPLLFLPHYCFCLIKAHQSAARNPFPRCQNNPGTLPPSRFYPHQAFVYGKSALYGYALPLPPPKTGRSPHAAGQSSPLSLPSGRTGCGAGYNGRSCPR